MKRVVLFALIVFFLVSSCYKNSKEMKKILFLHHSTGWNIWLGETNKYIYKLTGKSAVSTFVNSYDDRQGRKYSITEKFFPKASPYGWNNYPYDYYNIWVKHCGNSPYLEEPTLEMLTKEYDLIIFKHCYPGSNIKPDTGSPDIDSQEKTIENYKLQYNALKKKMHEFPNNKFIIWTPAVRLKNQISLEEAERTRLFYDWVINDWNEKGDNIYIWDFYKYETEGGLYLLDNYAAGTDDSHPNEKFSVRVAPLFGKFIIDVLEGKSE